MKRGLSKAKERNGRLLSCLGSLLTVKKKKWKRKKIGNFAGKPCASFEAASPPEFSSERKNAGRAKKKKEREKAKSLAFLANLATPRDVGVGIKTTPDDNDLNLQIFFFPSDMIIKKSSA